MSTETSDFIRGHTSIATAPMVPEIRLHLATEIDPIWQATEAWLDRHNLPPPFWAFCWPGGQALARYVLDTPGIVDGRRVLDFATGCGIAAIAAVRGGAAAVEAYDTDAVAIAAAGLNATLNDVVFTLDTKDLIGSPNLGWDIVLAGDVCYEQPMSDVVTGWLRGLAAGDTTVLMADPGRNFMPGDGLEEVATYDVPTSRELEDLDVRSTTVWRVLPG